MQFIQYLNDFSLSYLAAGCCFEAQIKKAKYFFDNEKHHKIYSKCETL